MLGDLLMEDEQGLTAAGAAAVDGGASADVRASVALMGEVLSAGSGSHYHPYQHQRRGGSGEEACSSCSEASGSASHQQPDGAWSDQRQLLGVKGPGDSLGLPSLLHSPSRDHKWRAFCRARGPVTVFTARVRDLQQLAAEHPEFEPAVQEIATQQATDMAVAEALRRLRLYNNGGGGGGAAAGGKQQRGNAIGIAATAGPAAAAAAW